MYVFIHIYIHKCICTFAGHFGGTKIIIILSISYGAVYLRKSTIYRLFLRRYGALFRKRALTHIYIHVYCIYMYTNICICIQIYTYICVYICGAFWRGKHHHHFVRLFQRLHLPSLAILRRRHVRHVTRLDCDILFFFFMRREVGRSTPMSLRSLAAQHFPRNFLGHQRRCFRLCACWSSCWQKFSKSQLYLKFFMTN